MWLSTSPPLNHFFVAVAKHIFVVFRGLLRGSVVVWAPTCLTQGDGLVHVVEEVAGDGVVVVVAFLRAEVLVIVRTVRAREEPRQVVPFL